MYDRWTQSHLPFEYHSYGSNQQGGFCPKGILSILWRGFCPPCKNHEGDYVNPVKSFKGDYVHLVKNMKGISSTYAKMSRGDFVRRGYCPDTFFLILDALSEKSALKHTQNMRIHISLYMCRVSSGHLLSYSIVSNDSVADCS